MSLNNAFLLWIGLAAVYLNPTVAFVGTLPCFNAPALTAKTTCSPSLRTFATTPSYSVYSNDHAKRIRKPPSQPLMTMANAESETSQQAVEKPVSQARFKETVQTLFEQIDMDGNGIIDLEEVQNLAGNFYFVPSPSVTCLRAASLDTDACCF